MTDIELLRKAWERENDTRDYRPPGKRSWQGWHIGATASDLHRLKTEELIAVAFKEKGLTKYILTRKGSDLAMPAVLDREFARVDAPTIMEALSLVVGFDDVKETLASAISAQRKVNFMLEGPPACAKSIMLEGIRAAVPEAFMAFGSRTSAAGLSQILFEYQPRVLLLDEADKMRSDVYSVLLGLMERGEILETKSRNVRGITLETTVIAACNSSEKMPREFLSRFALHVNFPTYTRDEFVDVCRGFLTRAEECSEDLATLIGVQIWDGNLGDVRKARGVWDLITAPTEAEVHRVVQLMMKYSAESNPPRKRRKASTGRMPGM